MNILERKKTLLEYFNGDEMAGNVWKDKYAMEGEETPDDMHLRMSKEFARIEEKLEEAYSNGYSIEKLSEFGQKNFILTTRRIYEYLKDFKWIVPQGSIMAMLGNTTKIGSLSNCFVIPDPYDSYGGILKTDERIIQLMKRRGGVGFGISTLRSIDTPVTNAAGTSTGAVSFMPRYSNSTREVAQNGRRGALMILIHVKHPDIFKFVVSKKDRTQITGANISVMLTDKFMRAVQEDGDFVCTFPIDTEVVSGSTDGIEYNKLYTNPTNPKINYMKIRAKELFDLIVEMAWENAEPGIAFIDRVHDYSPDGVYEQFRATASNPCGEQWMQPYDACRLLTLNLFSVAMNPFRIDSKIDFDKLYEIAYIQQRLADDIVELELEYIIRIINKIKADPEPDDIKATELELWNNVYATTKASRRTGCGLTGLGDMLAALGLPYDCDKSLEVIEKVMKTKMRAELDCTIDLAILRGTFEGWDGDKEIIDAIGENEFYQMICDDFPDQAWRMHLHGRRNVSMSTVAPVGTGSFLTQTTSGLEPLFLGFYTRRVKIVDEVKADFTDQNGDKWKEYAVLHPKFKQWIEMGPGRGGNIEDFTKEELQVMFEKSPWFESTANDIDWEKRIEIQAIIQKYTTNAISSTINLPGDVSKEKVADIYKAAWKAGLKGVTIYRDGCRTGVLLKEKSSFEYKDAVKRPKELDAELHVVSVKGEKYAVAVGLFEGKPYEIFAFKAEAEVQKVKSLKGKITKVRKGHYNFTNCEEGNTIKDLQIMAESGEEQTLTRLVSGMLRHGAKPDFVSQQIEKCDLEVVSFGKALTRILNKFVEVQEVKGDCPECKIGKMIREEGCSKCKSCGFSKC